MGVVLRYTVSVHNCIMIGLYTKILTEFLHVCTVVSITRVHKLTVAHIIIRTCLILLDQKVLYFSLGIKLVNFFQEVLTQGF